MKILIDDERNLLPDQTPPDIICRTFAGSMMLLESLISYPFYGDAEIYLDHDLGSIDPSQDGHHIMKFIEKMAWSKKITPKKVVCVSSNPQGRSRIEAAIKNIYGRIPR